MVEVKKTKRQWAYYYFLRSDRWKRAKDKVLKRHRKKWKKKKFIIPDNSFICKRCECIFPLSKSNFHHISYSNSYWGEDGWTRIKNIVIVCSECHKKIHGV